MSLSGYRESIETDLSPLDSIPLLLPDSAWSFHLVT